jgi:hypothetical protein
MPLKLPRLCALALAVLPVTPAMAGTCRSENLMPEYFAFAARTAAMAPAQRADAFVTDFALHHPEFYVPEDFGDAGKLRERAARFFDPATVVKFPGAMPLTDENFHAAALAAVPALEEISAQYDKEFPDFRCNAAISFGVSLNRFDAYGFTDGRGHDFMRFGIDMMARLHKPRDMPTVFAHVLFQIYFSQLYPQVTADDFGVTWQAAWLEGVSTYISMRMTAPHDEQQVLWFSDEAMAQMQKPEVMAQAARAMLADFGKGDDQTYGNWFKQGASVPGLPSRAGYYLGLRMAEELGRRYTLSQIAHMPPQEQRRRMKAFLQEQAAR